MEKTLEQRIYDARFDYTNGLLRSEHFAVLPMESNDNAVLLDVTERYEHEDALAFVANEGYRPANIYELIEWKDKNGDALTEDVWIVALGQTWGWRVPFVSHQAVEGQLGLFTLSLGFKTALRGNEKLLVFPLS